MPPSNMHIAFACAKSQLPPLRYPISVEHVLLDTETQPRGLWNTHLDCLQVIADTAWRDLDLIDIAGITGLGFRTALCAQAIPPSTYLSWSFTQAFTTWLGQLGVEADCSTHRRGMPTYAGWTERQVVQIRNSLERGYPCIYWDNLGFGLVVGIDGKRLEVTGLPRRTVHPVWHEHPETKEFSSRLGEYPMPDDSRYLHSVAVDSVVNPNYEDTAFFACPTGVCGFDAERAALESLHYINAELCGRIEYPRISDDGVNVFLPQFGTNAIERLRGELELRQVHDFGLIQFVQVTAEARGLGYKYLKRLTDRVEPEYKGRIEQVAEFFLRTQSNWGVLKRIFDVPLNREEKMRSGKLIEAREQLYQISQTEKTAGRLLSGVVSELFETA